MVVQRKTQIPRSFSAASQQVAREPVLQVQRLVISAANDGQRLDNFLLRWAKGVPKSHVYRVVRSGQVRVNGGRARADTRLVLGDELRIPPMRLAAERPAVAPAHMPPVLFEDEHLLIINKPAGVAAHGGSGVAHGVIERVRAARPQNAFLELGHRLDRETSGALILAKTRRCLLGLHEMMRSGGMDKRYLAVVIGDWVNDKQHVRARLLKKTTASGEKRVSVDETEGVEAHTIFYLRGRFKGFSLVEAELRTGRTHQIRVHLAHLGFQILGDDKYGNFDINRQAAKGAFGPRLDRMFLHAWRLGFPHPVTGEPVTLEAPMPPDLVAWLDFHDPDNRIRHAYEQRLAL